MKIILSELKQLIRKTIVEAMGEGEPITADELEYLHGEGKLNSIKDFCEYLAFELDRMWVGRGEIQLFANLVNAHRVKNGKIAIPFKEFVDGVEKEGITISAVHHKPEPRGFTSNNHDRFSRANGAVSGHGIGNASRQMISPTQPR